MKRTILGFLFLGFLSITPNLASAQPKANGDTCAVATDCVSGFCDAATTKCADAPAPAIPTICVDDDDCPDWCKITKFGPNPRGVCSTGDDPCLALPFADNSTYACELVSMLDLGMSGYPASVRGVLLKMSPKRFEAFSKTFALIVRQNVVKFMDYKAGARDRILKEGTPGYWDDAKVVEKLKAGMTFADGIGMAGHTRTTTAGAPKDRD